MRIANLPSQALARLFGLAPLVGPSIDELAKVGTPSRKIERSAEPVRFEIMPDGSKMGRGDGWGSNVPPELAASLGAEQVEQRQRSIKDWVRKFEYYAAQSYDVHFAADPAAGREIESRESWEKHRATWLNVARGILTTQYGLVGGSVVEGSDGRPELSAYTLSVDAAVRDYNGKLHGARIVVRGGDGQGVSYSRAPLELVA